MTFPGFTCGNLRKGTKSRKLKILRFGDCKGEVKRRGRERERERGSIHRSRGIWRRGAAWRTMERRGGIGPGAVIDEEW